MSGPTGDGTPTVGALRGAVAFDMAGRVPAFMPARAIASRFALRDAPLPGSIGNA